MPLKVSLSMIPGDVIYHKAFDRLGDSLGTISNYADTFFEWFRKMAKDQFDKKGDPKRWVKLSPKYFAWKNRRYPGRPLLVLNGHLRNAVTKEYSQYQYHRKNKTLAEIGTKELPYARVHQFGFFGSQIGRRVTINIPARPYVQTENYSRDLEKRFQKVLVSLWREDVEKVFNRTK